MCAPGSSAAVLQCGALRRAAAAAPDPRRPGVAASARHSSCTETGTTGGFLCLARQYRFSEPALHAYAKEARVSFLTDHLTSGAGSDATTRAYQALNCVCVRKAKRVRFKVGGAGSIVSRTSATIQDSALSCSNQRRGTTAFSSGRTITCPLASIGTIRWSNMGWIIASSTPASSGVLLPVLVRKGLIARETATSCNWRWQGCLFTSPRTLSAQTTSGWTWVPQLSPVCHVRARRGWSS